MALNVSIYSLQYYSLWGIKCYICLPILNILKNIQVITKIIIYSTYSYHIGLIAIRSGP